MKITDIRLNPENPRIIKDDKFKKLVQSLKDFPQMMALRPIIINGDNIIQGGNMRYQALLQLGYKEIPDEWVKKGEDLTEDQWREFVIKDNASFGEWNFEELANSWNAEELDAWGLDIPGIDDFSGKNKEINTENFDDEMIIKLKYTEDDYIKVKEQLSKIAITPEMAVWKLLGNE